VSAYLWVRLWNVPCPVQVLNQVGADVRQLQQVSHTGPAGCTAARGGVERAAAACKVLQNTCESPLGAGDNAGLW